MWPLITRPQKSQWDDGRCWVVSETGVSLFRRNKFMFRLPPTIIGFECRQQFPPAAALYLSLASRTSLRHAPTPQKTLFDPSNRAKESDRSKSRVLLITTNLPYDEETFLFRAKPFAQDSERCWFRRAKTNRFLRRKFERATDFYMLRFQLRYWSTWMTSDRVSKQEGAAIVSTGCRVDK